MISLPLTEFMVRFPHRRLPSVQEVYESAFHPSQLLFYFIGWEYFTEYNCYIDYSEDRNMIRFGTDTYFLNGSELRWPSSLNAFIQDCQANQIQLRWSESLADKLWMIS
jgi:hypothetical protein